MTDAPIASLPMYDWPEVHAAMDRLWAGVAARCRTAGVTVPDALERRADYQGVWTAPGLVLSQTCGYPYVKSLRGKVALVGAPVYDAEGCSGPTYRSMMIVRRDDAVGAVPGLRGRRAVINGRDSQSGYSALRAIVAPYAGGGRMFSDVSVSGSHRASLRAVAEGRADVATIDAVCWAMAERHEPAAFAGLRVLALSPVAPSLPFVTARTRSAEQRAMLRDALREAIAAQAAYLRKELLLTGVEPIEDAAYDRIVEIEAESIALGYPEVA
ncbi:MAG: PhnD/SsuA/transferrin family substrate-binding protein [Hyphomicrobiaceae bacterium]